MPKEEVMTRSKGIPTIMIKIRIYLIRKGMMMMIRNLNEAGVKEEVVIKEITEEELIITEGEVTITEGEVVIEEEEIHHLEGKTRAREVEEETTKEEGTTTFEGSQIIQEVEKTSEEEVGIIESK